MAGPVEQSQEPAARRPNRYVRLIERLFERHYTVDATELTFEREDIERVARELGLMLPKNLGDVIYSFRYRTALPATIQAKAPAGREWIIRPAGRGRYTFVAVGTPPTIVPDALLAETKVPDATPGMITMYALSDEQALLARLRCYGQWQRRRCAGRPFACPRADAATGGNRRLGERAPHGGRSRLRTLVRGHV